jgi:hypothetical protein
MLLILTRILVLIWNCSLMFNVSVTFVEFETLRAVVMKSSIFSDITP